MADDDDINRAALDRSRERWRKRVGDAVKRDNKERARTKSSQVNDDRESEDAITGVHERLDEIVDRMSHIQIETPQSLQPGPNDSWVTRALKLALGSMHRNQRSWLVFAVALIAAGTLAVLIVQGRVKIVSEWIEPPREASPPWGGEPQVRPRHRPRARVVEPEPTE